MEEAMIQAQATAARIACARMTMPPLSALHDSVERASCLAARSQWDRKAASHAEIFVLLADVADDPALAPLLNGGAAYAQELMLAVGRAADGMIVSSRRRLLAYLRAGDEDGAALEMERHLRGLHYMWRLARRRHETGGRDRRAISLLTTDTAALT
jgi:GntR family transcriptional repressor for pyruvate dehydrogenase complex